MKQTSILRVLLLLTGILVLMYGCTQTSQPQTKTTTTPKTSSSSAVIQLKPEGTLPPSCPATPIYQGGQTRFADIPWVQAQPSTSGITGHLFFAQGHTTPSGTYRFLHTGGGYPDGSTTKILWIITYPQASGPLQVDGTNLAYPGSTFHQTIQGVAEIPSIIVVPSAGCWRLQLTSGNARGSIVLWAVE